MSGDMSDNSELTIYYHFVRELAAWRSQFIEFATRLRQEVACKDVVSEIDVRMYESGLAIELFVDAELHSGSAIADWIDVTPEARSSWHVSTFIGRMEGQEQVPVRTTDEDAGSLAELTAAIDRSLALFIATDPTVAL
jgi:hypothetical protein